MTKTKVVWDKPLKSVKNIDVTIFLYWFICLIFEFCHRFCHRLLKT